MNDYDSGYTPERTRINKAKNMTMSRLESIPPPIIDLEDNLLTGGKVSQNDPNNFLLLHNQFSD